jgi:asparagine synthase (glutamine-hydrolysing)
MLTSLSHRGPDETGAFHDPGGRVALGARRLSIIDIDGGHQPMQNEDGTVTVVFNGEIYNHPMLRARLRAGGHRLATHADTEVLVHLYEEYGPQLVHALEGMYAFALWDAERELLLLARDRFGEKPLVYVERSGELAFASELDALVAGGACGWELDPEAIDEYFTFGYINAPRSVVFGVRQLPPGHTLVWRRGERSRVEPYWTPPAHADRLVGSLDELVLETEAVLEDSVRSRLIADVPVGVFLSGGVDSTLVAALAARNTTALRTFTVAYDAGRVGEASPARKAAELIGAQHRELVFTTDDVAGSVPDYVAALDQPVADEAFVALRAVSDFARKEVKVAVGGEGADELFGGYPRYSWLARAARLDGLPSAVRVRAAQLASGLPGRGGRLGDVLAPMSFADRHVDWVTSHRRRLRSVVYGPRLREHVERTKAEGRPRESQNGSIEGALMRLDQEHWLPGDVLAKADRASMQASLELRTPYLHRKVAEFAATVPPVIHVSHRGKVLLRRVLQRALPDAPYERAKTAFRTPTAEWLRGPLAPAIRDHLDTSSLYEDEWFDRGAVRHLVEEHVSGAADRTKVIWPLFVLGTWLDRRSSS